MKFAGCPFWAREEMRRTEGCLKIAFEGSMSSITLVHPTPAGTRKTTSANKKTY